MPPAKTNASRVAILFFSHVFDPTAFDHLTKLRDESAGVGAFFVYADIHGQDPGQSRDVVTFDFDAIKKSYPRILGRTLIPGNCHLTLLDFFRRYPDFEYYWIVEYDVVFTGHWRDFFAAFADRDDDFIACHLRRHDEEPEWYFWKTIEPPPGRPLPRDRIRAFCPIQRVSRRSLELLEVRAREGWGGHFECLVPTLLHEQGYSLLDIGGDGRYVPRAFRNRFYTSFSLRNGSLLFLGSMRFRPGHLAARLPSKPFLYHPVKAPHRRLKQTFAYVGRNLLRHPVRFSVALVRLCSASWGR